METLIAAWSNIQRQRNRGAAAVVGRGAYRPPQQPSAVRRFINIIGFMLCTFVAVNALLLLELLPSALVPSFLSPSKSSSASSSSSESSPSPTPSQFPRYAHPRLRIRPTLRRRSTYHDGPTKLMTLRGTLPAGPATTDNETSLFLTKLPLELRQEIYKYVLAGRHKQLIRLGSDDVAHPADFKFAGTPYRTRDSLITGAPAWSRRGSERSGRLLALPLVSRQVYNESIEMMYRAVVFKACRLVTIADMSRALAPANHLGNVRELELAYEFRCGLPLRRGVALVEDADWNVAWDIISQGMPGLHRLRVDLFAFDISPLIDPEEDRLVDYQECPERWHWLAAMLRPTHLRTAQLKLHYIKRLTDVPWERPARPLRWFTMVAMEALERTVESTWMGKRLDPETPPFTMPKEGSKDLTALWQTCCQMQKDLGTTTTSDVVRKC